MRSREASLTPLNPYSPPQLFITDRSNAVLSL